MQFSASMKRSDFPGECSRFFEFCLASCVTLSIDVLQKTAIAFSENGRVVGLRRRNTSHEFSDRMELAMQ